MSFLNQEFVVFEDDDIAFDIPLDVIEFNNVHNVGSYDNVLMGWSTTPGGSYVLQLANYNWDQGILGGNAYSLITQNFTGATQGTYNVSPTSGGGSGNNGSGAILNVQVNSSGVINSAVCEFTQGGNGYEPNDVLTFPASNFGTGTSQDLVITLPSTFPNFPSANSATLGRIRILSPEGPSGQAIIRVYLKQGAYAASSGPLVTGTTYYWELVIGEIRSYTFSNYDVPTQVVATGTMYVSGSMFSKKGLRPN